MVRAADRPELRARSGTTVSVQRALSTAEERPHVVEDDAADGKEPAFVGAAGIETYDPFDLPQRHVSEVDGGPQFVRAIEKCGPEEAPGGLAVVGIEEERGDIEGAVALARTGERHVPVDDSGNGGAVGEDVGVAEVEVDDVGGGRACG